MVNSLHCYGDTILIVMENKKKIFIILSIVFVAFILWKLWKLHKINTPEKYILNNEKANEVIYSEDIDKDKTILFFIDNMGDLNCSLLQNTLLGYKTLKTSGKINPNFPGLLLSFLRPDDRRWIIWGIITEENKNQFPNDSKTKYIEKFNFVISWYFGSGVPPSIEKEV